MRIRGGELPSRDLRGRHPGGRLLRQDLQCECERLRELGVRFKREPARWEWGFAAAFDDTCGNLVGLQEE